MTIWQKILVRLGVQFVMMRTSHQLTFRVRQCYLIGGRYYTRKRYLEDTMDQPRQKMLEKGDAFYMLTDATRLRNAVDLEPGTMVMSHALWVPLTDHVDAQVSMYSDNTGALSSAATGSSNAQASNPTPIAK